MAARHLIPSRNPDDTTTLALWLVEPNAPVNHTLLSASSLPRRQADLMSCFAQLEAAFPPKANHESLNEERGPETLNPAAKL